MVLTHLRRRAGAVVVDNTFRALASIGRLHPGARPERHGVIVEKDIAYAPTGSPDHTLDVYRPADATGSLPIVLYIHGGGFRILSKDVLWVMALAYARRGYLVFSINYRLAPKYPFPAAIEDCSRAYRWVVENAHRWGGDVSRLVLAGESAGANLVTSMALAASTPRQEQYAQTVHALQAPPRAVVAACGIFQVSDIDRFRRRKRLSPLLMDRLEEVHDAYFAGHARPSPGEHPLADPLVEVESDLAYERPLPPFFLPVGTADPLLDDTRRLGAALARRNVPVDVKYYPGELHAFHALVFRKQARECWRDVYSFLDRHVPRNP